MRGRAPQTPHPEPVEGEPVEGRGSSAPTYFAKPTLSDMGPGTDLPTPNRPETSLFRKNTLDEMTVGRTEKPRHAGKLPEKPTLPARAKPDDDAKPIRRERVGLGSYEDPGEVKRKGRRTGKTGRPGR